MNYLSSHFMTEHRAFYSSAVCSSTTELRNIPQLDATLTTLSLCVRGQAAVAPTESILVSTTWPAAANLALWPSAPRGSSSTRTGILTGSGRLKILFLASFCVSLHLKVDFMMCQQRHCPHQAVQPCFPGECHPAHLPSRIR